MRSWQLVTKIWNCVKISGSAEDCLATDSDFVCLAGGAISLFGFRFLCRLVPQIQTQNIVSNKKSQDLIYSL
jgi:hypothetical protein